MSAGSVSKDKMLQRDKTSTGQLAGQMRAVRPSRLPPGRRAGRSEQRCIKAEGWKLPRLTSLLLDGEAGPSLRTQLTALTNLQSLTFMREHSGELPLGPWLSSLRRLSAPGNMLRASLPALAAPARLEFLGINDLCKDPAQPAAPALLVAGGLPALPGC